jgi:hypothetical protein
MRVWQEDPTTLRIVIPEIYRLKDFLPVIVERDGRPLRDARVTLTGGRGEVFVSKKTNSDGKAGFMVPGAAGALEHLTVTVWSLEGRLHRGIIRNGD